MERNGHVDPVRFVVKRVAWLIDSGVEKTFRDIQAVHQLGPILNVGCYEWKMALELGITLASRPDYKLEQFVGRLGRISLESDRAQSHQRAFVDLEPQPVAILDFIMNVR